MGDTTAVINESFSELTASFTRGQRQYLTLRAMGSDKHEALKITQFSHASIESWVSDPKFKAVCELVVAKRDVYASQALTSLVESMKSKAQWIVNHILEKGLEWDKLDRYERGHVLQIIRLMGGQIDKDKTLSYDELILRRHHGN